MLKMAKKSLLVVGLLLCMAGMGMAVYASFPLYSNVVGPVTINYAITLTGGYPTLTATITGTPTIPEGTAVWFWYYGAPTGTISGTPAFDPATWVHVGTNNTIAGVALWAFSPPNNAYDYWFVANFTAP